MYLPEFLKLKRILSPTCQKEIRVEVFKETAAAPYTEQMFQISKEVYREYLYPQFGFTAPWVNVDGIETLPHWLVFWIKSI